MDEFPSNAHRNVDPPKKVEKKKVEKVVVGEIVQRKKPLGLRIKDVFFGGELKSAGRYIAADVLLPALRTMVMETVTKGTERMIYGDQTPQRRSNSTWASRPPRVQYNTPVERYGPQQREHLYRGSHYIAPRQTDLDGIIFQNREDAENVIDGLSEIMDTYGQASVADFKELVGIPSNYVDNNWGWTSINYINLNQTRDGYMIDLPRTEPIG